jgi:hypothetical protein
VRVRALPSQARTSPVTVGDDEVFESWIHGVAGAEHAPRRLLVQDSSCLAATTTLVAATFVLS